MNETRITSRQNPQLVHIRKLLSSRSYREKTGEFAADGTKLLAEAIRWCSGLKTVVLADNVQAPDLPDAVQVLRVPGDVMESISPMQTPQGALFVCKLPKDPPLQLTPGTLILDRIQDPGNVGTILRTADALDIPVVLTPDCADVYNAKTVRATMGAAFRTPPVRASREEILAACEQENLPLAVTLLSDNAVDIRAARLSDCVVVIGSEGQGVGEELIRGASKAFIIPMNPRCESLNAAVAATIIMWQMKL